MLATKRVSVGPLISHRFEISRALEGYELIESKPSEALAVVLEYPEQLGRAGHGQFLSLAPSRKTSQDQIGVGIIGAGLFAKAILLPELAKTRGIRLRGLATSSGPSAEHWARKLGFEYCCTDYSKLLADEQVQAVFVLTRHNLHEKMVCDALSAGKSVFVEKPLCLTEQELRKIHQAYLAAAKKSQPVLMVGYNRRFAKLTSRAQEFFANRQGPMMLDLRVNAGEVPPDHWVHDPDIGGGRLLSEGCHFVDLTMWLCQTEPVSIYAQQVDRSAGDPDGQNVSLIVKAADGSVGQILYTGCGHRAFSRERIELFAEGSVLAIDDFRTAWTYRGGKRKRHKLLNQDMGYAAELDKFFSSIRGTTEPIGFDSYGSSTLATIRANESLRLGKPLGCSWPEFLAEDQT